jgi:hypothetical protein
LLGIMNHYEKEGLLYFSQFLWDPSSWRQC